MDKYTYITILKEIYETSTITKDSHNPKCEFPLYLLYNYDEIYKNYDMTFSQYVENTFNITKSTWKKENVVTIEGQDYIDFLSILYPNMKFISKFHPEMIPSCKFAKIHPDAVTPTKNRATDVGYDLTIIKEDKKISAITTMYGTGIIVMPQIGYYTKIVPRSSLVKSGYILSNSIGIVDSNYRGELKVVLTKIDNTLPDIELPFTCVQLILEKHIHYNMEEVKPENITKTSRGAGGFGSTDKNTETKLITTESIKSWLPVTSPGDASALINKYCQKNGVKVEYIYGDIEGPGHNSKFTYAKIIIPYNNSKKSIVVENTFHSKKEAKLELNVEAASFLLGERLVYF